MEINRGCMDPSNGNQVFVTKLTILLKNHNLQDCFKTLSYGNKNRCWKSITMCLKAKRDNLVPSSQLRNLNELNGGGDMYLVAHCN